MARRGEHSRDELRDMALHALREIVEQEGFQQLSTRKVAARIHYTVGTLYQLFSNLDEMILYANAATLDELYRNMQYATRRCRTPECELRSLARSYLLFSQQHANRWKMLFDHRSQHDALPPWYQARIDALFAMVESSLKPLFSDYTPLRLSRTARAIWSGVHGIGVLATDGNMLVSGEQPVMAVLENLLDHFVAAHQAGAKNARDVG